MRGVSHRLGVGEGIQKRFLFGCDAKFSHSFGPWQKTSSKEKGLQVQIAPHRTRKMSNFSGFVAVWTVFVVLLVVVTKLWQQRCFWYVVRTQIDLGSGSTVFLKT